MRKYIVRAYTWLYEQFSYKPAEKRREDTDSRTLNLVAKLNLVNNIEKQRPSRN